jgi:hypothetical protein
VDGKVRNRREGVSRPAATQGQLAGEKRRASGLVSISLASARARGRKGGRPAKLPAKQVCSARKMAEPGMTIKEVAEAFGVNRATIYRSFGLGSYAKGATGDAA